MKFLNWVIVLSIAWLVFVVSLSIWWMIFSLRTIRQLNVTLANDHFLRQQNMLVMEGSVLILLLVIGGVGLIYYALREKRQLEEVRLFFSTFSHDLKTSITRLILQGERLTKNNPEGHEFHKNLMTLEAQLDNSLHLAQLRSRGLVFETLELKNVISRLHTSWPDLKINLSGKGILVTDRTALESVFKNLLSNSSMHGAADEIFIRQTITESSAIIEYSDNSKTVFPFPIESVGYQLSPSQKGSGIGLYIVRQWIESVKGSVEFQLSEIDSLKVKITIPIAKGSH